MKKVLFISHNATRSGAPIFFLNLITWLKENKAVVPYILLVDGGALELPFRTLGPTWVWQDFHGKANIKERIAGKISRKLKGSLYHERILRTIKKEQIELIYANTIVATKLASKFKAVLHIPSLLHLHEMSFSASHYYPEFIQEKYIKQFNSYIAITSSVQKFLTTSLNVKEKDIFIIPPFFEINNREFIKTKENQFVIGCSGLANWRKGIDLLPTLIAHLYYNSMLEGLKFVWVGPIEEDVKEKIYYELSLIDCEQFLVFTGAVLDPENYYSTFDVMCLLSREDPFPLACLEAASLGIPLICFENTGGMADFIKNGESGFVVPFLNFQKLAEKITYFRINKEEREEFGRAAAIEASRYTIDNIADQIYSVLKETASV